MGHAMRAPTRRERQREADVRRDRAGLPRAAGRGRRAVAARGRGPDGRDRAGALPLRRELPGAGRPGRLRDRQGRDRADRRGRRGDPRRRPGRPAGGLRGEFRRWAQANPREFGLVFANPVADTACVRRELLTAATLRPLLPRPDAADVGAEPVPASRARRARPQVARGAAGPADPADIEKVARRTAACSGCTSRAGPRCTAWSRSRCSATWTRGSSRAARCSPR